METICVWGDSITYGASDTECGGWVSRLRNYLEKNIKGGYCEVYNLGVPGDTSEDVVRRFKVEAGARNPDLCIFAVGINDSASRDDFQTTRVPLSTFEQNLQTLIQEAKDFTPTIVFAGLTKVNDRLTQPLVTSEKGTAHRNQSIADFDAVIKSVCNAEALPFINMTDVLNVEEDLDDGLHPNAEGHEKIYLKVRDFLVNSGIIEITK